MLSSYRKCFPKQTQTHNLLLICLLYKIVGIYPFIFRLKDLIIQTLLFCCQIINLCHSQSSYMIYFFSHYSYSFSPLLSLTSRLFAMKSSHRSAMNWVWLHLHTIRSHLTSAVNRKHKNGPLWWCHHSVRLIEVCPNYAFLYYEFFCHQYIYFLLLFIHVYT